MNLKKGCFFKLTFVSVHIFSRMMFITDYGNVAKLERCNMDGTNRTQLVDYKIEQPTAVALDIIKKLVYWADAYLDYIDVVDYNGKNRHSIIHGIQVSGTFHCKHMRDFSFQQHPDLYLRISHYDMAVFLEIFFYVLVP